DLAVQAVAWCEGSLFHAGSTEHDVFEGVRVLDVEELRGQHLVALGRDDEVKGAGRMTLRPCAAPGRLSVAGKRLQSFCLRGPGQVCARLRPLRQPGHRSAAHFSGMCKELFAKVVFLTLAPTSRLRSWHAPVRRSS